MKISVKIRVPVGHHMRGKKAPLLSRVFRGEVGPAGTDEWTDRYFTMYLFRRYVSVGLHK